MRSHRFDRPFLRWPQLAGEADVDAPRGESPVLDVCTRTALGEGLDQRLPAAARQHDRVVKDLAGEDVFRGVVGGESLALPFEEHGVRECRESPDADLHRRGQAFRGHDELLCEMQGPVRDGRIVRAARGARFKDQVLQFQVLGGILRVRPEVVLENPAEVVRREAVHRCQHGPLVGERAQVFVDEHRPARLPLLPLQGEGDEVAEPSFGKLVLVREEAIVGIHPPRRGSRSHLGQDQAAEPSGLDRRDGRGEENPCVGAVAGARDFDVG